jgi:hypothetical protein
MLKSRSSSQRSSIQASILARSGGCSSRKVGTKQDENSRQIQGLEDFQDVVRWKLKGSASSVVVGRRVVGDRRRYGTQLQELQLQVSWQVGPQGCVMG